jgi:hypothetical protein
MDILAHTLWANAGARGVNGLRAKTGKAKIIHPGWTGFWGVFPDLFAFTIPFVVMIWRVIIGQAPLSQWHDHHAVLGGFDLAAYLYQWSHSLVIWAAVFIIVWIISKRPRWELLGWALHILIDIPSHVIDFYPTPFLFPISEYRFPYGLQWSNMWYMIINYAALAGVWIWIIVKKRKSKTV